VPSRNQWILTAPCGCPMGVMEGTIAKNEAQAFDEMYDSSERHIEEAKARGMEMKLISFEEYTDKYYDMMFDPCPH
jgi:hypothetical protein